MLLDNLRFYILASSVLASLLAAALLRIQIPGDQLYAIRLEQLYGLLSVIFLYAALATSPLGKLFAGRSWTRQLIFARRAVGVSAAYFALLHVTVSLWGQMGGLPGIMLLPSRFQISLLLGTISLVILLAMAATSFDAVIRSMTFPRWKWLHRLVYAGSLLIVLHVWMIGTHLANPGIRLSGFIALSVFFALEAYRLTLIWSKRHEALRRKTGFALSVIAIWLLLTASLALLPRAIPSFHSSHSTTPARHNGHEAAP